MKQKIVFLLQISFLPTRNIKHLLELSADIFTKDIESISNLLGISCEDIQMFLDHLKEKEKIITDKYEAAEVCF